MKTPPPYLRDGVERLTTSQESLTLKSEKDGIVLALRCIGCGTCSKVGRPRKLVTACTNEGRQ